MSPSNASTVRLLVVSESTPDRSRAPVAFVLYRNFRCFYRWIRQPLRP